jgi:hypothetical protein
MDWRLFEIGLRLVSVDILLEIFLYRIMIDTGHSRQIPTAGTVDRYIQPKLKTRGMLGVRARCRHYMDTLLLFMEYFQLQRSKKLCRIPLS